MIQIYHLDQDVSAFGMTVTDFPAGICTAFDALVAMVPDGAQRSAYGLSCMDENGQVRYEAALAETSPGESGQYHCKHYTIPNGDYLTVTIKNWRSQTDQVKNVFHEMMQDERYDASQPCVEWYKNDEEMVCMLSADPAKTLLAAIRDCTLGFLDLVAAQDDEFINTVPFEGSWTAAQVLVHVTKSIRAMAQAMDMQGSKANRNASARVQELKDTFLNFTIRFQSPAFIVPPSRHYDGREVMSDLEQATAQLKEKATRADMQEMIAIPAFGEITKLELLHFVWYHSQRHLRQCHHILQALAIPAVHKTD